MLQKSTTILLIISFVSIAVFGFIAMDGGGSGHTHGGCIAAAVSGVRSCQDSGEGMESLLFHVKAFQYFSQGLIGSIFALAMLCLVALLGFVWLVAGTQSPFGKQFYVSDAGRGARIRQRTRRRIIYWLALHESRADRAYMGA